MFAVSKTIICRCPVDSPAAPTRERSASATDELRRQIAAERHRADVVELAVEIGPDFAAHVGPALAESEILAEIGAVFVDQTFEQREAVVACVDGIERMVSLITQLRVSGAHAFQRLAPDHEKASPGVADLDETGLFGDGVWVV